MADARTYTQSPPEPVEPRRFWTLSGFLDHLFSFLLVTIVGWLLSILLEWTGMVFGWWDQPGAGHSEQLLRTELAWLNQDFTTPLAAARLIDWAHWGAYQFYHYSGLSWLVGWVVSDQPSFWAGIDLIRAVLRRFGEYLLAASYITQLVGARLIVVIFTFPAYIAIGLMAVVDGLVCRDLRRLGGGLESGFLYHHLKTMIRPMLSVPVFLYLISPWSVHPTVLFIPFVLGFGYFIQRTFSKFKKYL